MLELLQFIAFEVIYFASECDWCEWSTKEETLAKVEVTLAHAALYHSEVSVMCVEGKEDDPFASTGMGSSTMSHYMRMHRNEV